MGDRRCRECGAGFTSAWPRNDCGPCRGRAYRARHHGRSNLSARLYYRRNKTRILAEHSEQYYANPEPKRTRERERYYEKRERNLELKRLHYAANADRIKARVLEYAKRRPEVGMRSTHKRRALKQAATVDDTLTPAVIKRLYSAARRCPDCRCRLNKKNRSLDHIYPLSLGGAHSLLNIQVMCRSCNAKKHARPPLQLPLAGPSDGQRETRSERRRQELKVLRETVYRLYDSGSMRRDIAEVIGRTHSRVCQILNARKEMGR